MSGDNERPDFKLDPASIAGIQNELSAMQNRVNDGV